MTIKYQVVARHNGSETRLPELWDFRSMAEARAEWLRADAARVGANAEILVVAVERTGEGMA